MLGGSGTLKVIQKTGDQLIVHIYLQDSFQLKRLTPAMGVLHLPKKVIKRLVLV